MVPVWVEREPVGRDACMTVKVKVISCSNPYQLKRYSIQRTRTEEKKKVSPPFTRPPTDPPSLLRRRKSPHRATPTSFR